MAAYCVFLAVASTVLHLALDVNFPPIINELSSHKCGIRHPLVIENANLNYAWTGCETINYANYDANYKLRLERVCFTRLVDKQLFASWSLLPSGHPLRQHCKGWLYPTCQHWICARETPHGLTANLQQGWLYLTCRHYSCAHETPHGLTHPRLIQLSTLQRTETERPTHAQRKPQSSHHRRGLSRPPKTASAAWISCYPTPWHDHVAGGPLGVHTGRALRGRALGRPSHRGSKQGSPPSSQCDPIPTPLFKGRRRGRVWADASAVLVGHRCADRKGGC